MECKVDMSVLCRNLAKAMLSLRDDHGDQVFPPAGTRVLAYPAAHAAVADSQGDYGFVYVNVRIAPGRPNALKTRAGDCLLSVVKEHFAPVFERTHIGITLQIDEGAGQAYDGKHSNLHDLFL